MSKIFLIASRRLRAGALALLLASAGVLVPQMAVAQDFEPEATAEVEAVDASAVELAAEPNDDLTWKMADWVAATRDNQGLPFAIVDKAAATVFVFGSDGVLRGAAPVLLGSAVGDDSVPGIGDRELRDIAPEERTTPAGRFMARYGPATGGKQVLWVDYGTAISLHEVVTTNKLERRAQRLGSDTVDDNRITFGCINVAPDFYENVVAPTFLATDSVFYILPETKSLAEAFPRITLAGGEALLGGS